MTRQTLTVTWQLIIVVALGASVYLVLHGAITGQYLIAVGGGIAAVLFALRLGRTRKAA